MPSIASRYLGWLQEISTAIRVTRAPLLLSGLSFLVLSTPPQILELYLLLARNWMRFWPQALFGLTSLVILSLFIAIVSRGLIKASEDANESRRSATLMGSTVRALPGILGVLPLLGAALGLYTALQSTLTDPLLRSIAVFDAVKSPEALEKTVRAITSLTDVDRKIQDLFPNGGGPRDPRPEAEALNALSKVVRDAVPSAILDLPQKTKSLTTVIYSASGSCLLLALALFALSVRRQRTTALGDAARERLFHPAVLAAFLIAFLLLTSLFAVQSINHGRLSGYDFTAIPRALGTLALVNLCLIFLVFLSSQLTRMADRLRIPLVAPLIAIAFLASLLDLNDNHQVRLVASSGDDLATRRLAGNKTIPPTVADAFDVWFQSRPADYKSKFADKPYPVYVVAAQGGGIYAANLSGLFLARLYDRCPLIRHHVFAVSGVSGGSVGAGFFGALLNEFGQMAQANSCDLYLAPGAKPHVKGPLETKMELLLQADFLAPVAASFLFPDLLQRFIPVPITAFDRARAFEAGLESTWDTTVRSKSNPLRDPFWRHWRPDGDSPMLLLNATVAETGRQISMSPVDLTPPLGKAASTDLQTFHTAVGLPPQLDVPLSTAMSLSARFPVVMPAGLVRSESRTLHLVDGGYFENSAVESGLALIEQLRTTLCVSTVGDCEKKVEPNTNQQKTTFRFKLFALTEYDPTPEYHANDRKGGGGLNEILSPARAMYNARVARGDLAVGRMLEHKASSDAAGSVMLSHRIYGLPLGWQLSPQVQDIISAQVATSCSYGTGDEFLHFVQAFSAISWIDAGLELVDAERTHREPKKYFGTALGQILTSLKTNHCATMQMLITDNVWSPPT
jgi:hypothetical protein